METSFYDAVLRSRVGVDLLNLAPRRGLSDVCVDELPQCRAEISEGHPDGRPQTLHDDRLHRSTDTQHGADLTNDEEVKVRRDVLDISSTFKRHDLPFLLFCCQE